MAERPVEKRGFGAEMLRAAIGELESIALEQNSPELTAIVARMNRGQVTDAEPIFRSIAETYQATEDIEPAVKLLALRHLAAVQLWREPKGAIETLGRALRLAPHDADILIFLSILLFEARAYKEATPLLQRLIDLPPADENRRAMALGAETLGIVRHVHGELDAARELYEQSMRLFRQLEDDERLAECMGNLGLLYRRQGRLVEAASLFQDALELWRGADRPAETAQILGYLASVFFRQAEYDDAIELFAERAQINEEIGDRVELAADQANMGQCFFKKGNARNACNHWREALDIYAGLGRKTETGSLNALLQEHGSEKHQPAA